MKSTESSPQELVLNFLTPSQDQVHLSLTCRAIGTRKVLQLQGLISFTVCLCSVVWNKRCYHEQTWNNEGKTITEDVTLPALLTKCVLICVKDPLPIKNIKYISWGFICSHVWIFFMWSLLFWFAPSMLKHFSLDFSLWEVLIWYFML